MTRVGAVLMDLRMPGVDGIQATDQLTRAHPDVAVVDLTTFADDESILAALQAGARSLIGSGLSNREIAGQLFIGNATVKTHINRIFNKMGAPTDDTPSPTSTVTTMRLRRGSDRISR